MLNERPYRSCAWHHWVGSCDGVWPSAVLHCQSAWGVLTDPRAYRLEGLVHHGQACLVGRLAACVLLQCGVSLGLDALWTPG